MVKRSPGLTDRLVLALGAGLLGAAAILASQKAEMRATGREPSNTPAKAVEELSTIDVPDGAGEARLSTAAHFGFGTALGLGLVILDRVPEPARTPLFVAGAWGVGTGVLVALGLAKPPTGWTGKEFATDLGHHAVYGIAAAGAYGAGRRLLLRAQLPH